MYIEEMMYCVRCDNCKTEYGGDEEYKYWNDKSFASDVAEESGWCIDNDNHYCPSCWSYNDDDEIEINLNRFKK